MSDRVKPAWPPNDPRWPHNQPVTKPRTYTVRVAAELVDAYREWQRVRTIDADWIKVIPHEDGTAEVLLHNDAPPHD